MESTENDIPRELTEIVAKHTVCYEVYAHERMVRDTRVKTSFDLELYGTHRYGETRLSPGCGVCRDTYDDLKRIALWIMPKDERPSVYEILPFDAALHESTKRNLRPEVLLTIRIRHRVGLDQPIDACEERCLDEMRARLALLGVRQGGSVRRASVA
ncbi:MAG TPA: hypothetical protein VHB50_17625 [Bryobacteraceae bacterium]|nr:hypothetical protein [Bryobacteraceae bacterium]